MTTYFSPVPKPASAGAPRSAIALTRMAYANIRSGPGTRYTPVGDVRHHSLIVHYPASRTGDGWEWIEQAAAAGWVSTQVVSFEQVVTPFSVNTTPFDGQMAIWHARGDAVPEQDLNAFVASLKQRAPTLSQLWLNVCDWSAATGVQWMGAWDTRRSLAVDSVHSIDRWVEALADVGMTLCVWTTPRLGDVEGEIDLIAQACERQGVRALILHFARSSDFHAEHLARIDEYMSALRGQLPVGFHLGISMPMTRTSMHRAAMDGWVKHADSLHVQVSAVRMRCTSAQALQAAFAKFQDVKIPIIPCLHGDVDALEMAETAVLAVYRHGARGLSWSQSGIIHAGGWSAIQRVTFNRSLSKQAYSTVSIGDEIVLSPDDAGVQIHASSPISTKRFARQLAIACVRTEERIASAWATWTPPILNSGTYEIAAFIPMQQSNAHHARYHIKTGGAEVYAVIDQMSVRAGWATLGVVELDAGRRGDGGVMLSNLTGQPGRWIAFSAIRWRQIIEGAPRYGDGFDMPVGTPHERKSRKVWAAGWVDNAPYGKLHFVGTPEEAYSCGVELAPINNASAVHEVYAAANGVVIFVGRLPRWGNVIVIRHDPLISSGHVIYARYARLTAFQVRWGERVVRGTPIGAIHTAREFNTLHLDFSPTTKLLNDPGHWAGRSRDDVFKHYLDPRQFIDSNRPL